MTEHEQLLAEARNFCDPITGEVLQRMPDELMKELRAAKLARGVPGKGNERTGTYATWFVFFTDEIREQVLAKWREANRQIRHRRATAKKAKPQAVAAGAGAQSQEASKGELQQQRQRKKSAK